MYTGDFLSNLAVNIFPVIIAAVALLYRIAVQYLPAAKQDQLSKQVSNLASIADTVVSSIEQSMPNTPGIEKKAQAANDIEAILSAVGVKVAPELVSHAIEGAVYAMNQYKPTPMPVALPASSNVVAPVEAKKAEPATAVLPSVEIPAK